MEEKKRHNFYTAIMGIGDEEPVEKDPNRRFNIYTALGLMPEQRTGGDPRMAEQDHNKNRDERGFMESIINWVDKQRAADAWQGVPSEQEAMEAEGVNMQDMNLGGYIDNMADMVKESQGIGPETTFGEQIMNVAPAAARFGGDTTESQALPIPQYPGQAPGGLPGVEESQRVPFEFMNEKPEDEKSLTDKLFLMGIMNNIENKSRY